MTTTTPTDPHHGITCEQIEAILTVREKQLTEVRQRLTDEPRAAHPAALVRAVTDARRDARETRAELAAVRDRLTWREEQMLHRLTPDEVEAERLAVVATIEAALTSDTDALEALSPTSVAALRAQCSFLIEAVAAIATGDPALLDVLRDAVLTHHHGPATEGDDADA